MSKIGFIIMGCIMSVSAMASGSSDWAGKVGDVTHGFRLTRSERVNEANSKALFFEHVKSGAQLLYFANSDDNKVFSIAFKTVPEDSTGIAHILEHAVLCGSRKFPTKEPFVELMKGSVNTFLNAMTYPDKTIYPVASRNDKDFRNLMDVYMDAVLYPRIHQIPEILKQEGWHYEIDEKTKQLTYNGVVYNEMKGVYSSPDSVLERDLLQKLFPDTAYSNDSGGDPATIPSLTQEQFSAFHKRYYHPSNSLIFLYGNGDISEHLAFLDKEYLQAFDRQKVKADMGLQKPFARARRMVGEYSVNKDDATKGKTYLSLAAVVGKSTDAEVQVAFEILQHILLGTSSSPLKKALLEAGIGKSVDGYFERDVYQPYLSVTVKGSDPAKEKKFLEVTNKTLQKLVKEGIPPRFVEAAINRTEFLLREFEVRRYPKGLAYNTRALTSWLHGGDALAPLRFEPVLEKIKAQAGKKYFEKLIERSILKNPHKMTVVLQPKRGLDQQKARKLEKELAAKRKKMKPEAMAAIEAETRKLKERQKTPDPAEVLATIPLLDLKDLDKKAEVLPLEQAKVADVPFLKHVVAANGIAYLNLYWDATKVPQELVPYAALLSEVLGKVATERFSQEELQTEIDLHTGGIDQGLSVYRNKESLDRYLPKFVVRGKALQRKFPKLLELSEEITLRSKLDDRKRLQEILGEVKADLETSITTSGVTFPLKRAGAYISEASRYDDATSGLGYYEFVKKVEKDFSKKAPEVIAKLQAASKALFARENLTVSLGADAADLVEGEKALVKFVEAYPKAALTAQKYAFGFEAQNEAFVIPSKVQFVAKVADFRSAGFPYSGKLIVLRNIFASDYLWNRIRVLGGAYGAKTDFTRSGMLYFVSYRDPNLEETLGVYEQAAEYLRKFDVPVREMTKFIIGTVGDLDSPLTPSMKAEVSDARYFAGITQDEIQREREEVLSTRKEDIQAMSALIEKSLAKGSISVLGGEQKIQKNAARFGRVVKVLE